MPILKKASKRFDPARTLVVGFLIIITLGMLLLCLPISSKSRTFTPLLDCLFTSTSSACVTGFAVVDTYTHWSLFGQIVMAVLVQIGGLGFVTIITFFNITTGKKLGYRTLKNAAEDFTESSFEGGRKIFISIMKYSLIFELTGAAVLAIVFVPKYGIYGVWMGIFMSIMAFCNAGFDLTGMEGEFTSLMTYQDNAAVLITLALLTIVGGLGFIVWENFLNIKTRKKLSLHSKVVLVMTGILIVSGTVFFLIAEWNNPLTMKDMPFWKKLLNSFYCSVNTRCSGFENIKTSDMSEFSQLGAILLMFIGAAPGSTGGGIKVTTLMVIIMTVVSYIRNMNDVEIFRHKIDKLAVYRAMVISLLSMIAVAICSIVLYFSLPEGSKVGAVQCLFDAVSAFSTTGNSAGTLRIVGLAGKIILILTMFIGRVGPVSLVMSLVLNSAKRKNIVVPDGQILIG